MAAKDIRSSGNYDVFLHGKLAFCSVIKGFEMGRSYRIIQVGPKYNHKCP